MVKEKFFIREVQFFDIKKLFELSNEEFVRKNSFNTERITWEEHENWFKSKLDRKEPFYIAETQDKEFISQIRFDVKDAAYISISITSKFRGKHLASDIIKEISDKVDYEEIYAEIKSENLPSIKAFESAGYKCISKNKDFIKMVYKKNIKIV